VSFGPVRVDCDFVTASQVAAPELKACGDTPMGEAISRGIELPRERKNTYEANGGALYLKEKRSLCSTQSRLRTLT
jgi:uncharacterized protein YegL